jgi:peptidoglycan hydrolase CwlO-like protein
MTVEYFTIAITVLASTAGILWGSLVAISKFVKNLVEKQLESTEKRISQLEEDKENLQKEVERVAAQKETEKIALQKEVEKRDAKIEALNNKIDELRVSVYAMVLASKLPVEERNAKIDQILEKVNKLHN